MRSGRLKRQVVMLGPSPAARGGMASVIATYLAHGYQADGRCRFIATQCDGPRWRKLACALAALAACTALLLAGRIALLHVHLASGASFWRKAVFMGCARLFRCPVLLHLHGAQFREFIDVGLAGRRQRLALWLLGGSAAALALSADSADWLRVRVGIAQVALFPNPVGGTPPLARHTAPGYPREILFLGRLEQDKGVFDLLHAFALVHAEAADTRLVLAGEGQRAAVDALAARLGVAHAVLLPGWVDPAARARLLARAALFVLPSHQEQMPMALLEAMQARVPVVANAVGAVDAMLNGGECGFLVEKGEIKALAGAMLSVLADNTSADLACARAVERVRAEFMAERVLQRLRQRYEELAT